MDVINGVQAISEHGSLSILQYQLSNVLAIYVLIGCDYVEKFEYVTIKVKTRYRPDYFHKL